MHQRRLLLVALLTAAPVLAQTQPDAVLLRYPDVSADSICFRYDGDLWIVAKTGGTARRITSAAGNEDLPRFSPDGKSVAFQGNYDGSTDLYTLPVEGGIPARVTFHPDRETMCDWHPSGDALIYFSSEISGVARAPKVFTVSTDGGQPEALPMAFGTFAAIDPTGAWVAYTPTSREFRTWNRYQGGTAQDVWLFNLEDGTSRRVTDHPGTDAAPMWHGRDLCFVSDRGTAGIPNLYAFNLDSSETRQLTDLDKSGVKFPAIGPSDIVFEWLGKLHRYEFGSGKVVAVDVSIPMDRPYLREQHRDLSEALGAIEPSPSGKRVVVEARGEIFTVPTKEGVVRNLTGTSGVAERYPSWSPDGQWISYWSDRSGEYELTLRRSDGKPCEGSDQHGEQRVTTLGPGWKYAAQWAPDSKKLVFSLQSGELYLYDLASKELIRVDVNPTYGNLGVDWSADSGWFTWSRKHSQSQNGAIQLYDVADRRRHEVTSGMFNDASPAFDLDGDWLWFLSNRTFAPRYSEFDTTWIYTESTNLIAVPLRANVVSPFTPTSDEEPIEADEEEEVEEVPAEEAAEEDEAPAAMTIDLDGFEGRAISLPVSPGRVFGLDGLNGKAAYIRPSDEATGRGRGLGRGGDLKTFDMQDKQEATMLAGVRGYALTADGKKMMVRVSGGTAIIDAKPGQTPEPIDFSGVGASIDPRAEWEQLLRDAHKIFRDWFYDPGMHGVDWDGVRDRALAALPDVTSRADVSFLIGEMMAELNVGHSYNRGGPEDQPRPATGGAAVGLLGCDWSLEGGAYRIARVLGASYDTDARSPLSTHGLDVNAGDYVLAVNGQPVDAGQAIHAAFVGSAGRPTSLTVNAAPTLDGNEREVVVVPMSNERSLRYRDWVAGRRALVEELSGGRVGYVHVPSTGIDGQNELVRQFMGQYHKDALLVDERWNSGGQIPTRFVELLNRPLTNAWATRSGAPWQWPPVGHRGPKAMLINHAAGSGGDAFPYYFRQAGLGKLVGTRTWGGLVGISGNPALIDGGTVAVPTFAFFELDGTWGIEGHGVEPDIEVLDDPAKMADGSDPQLEAAVAHLLAELKTWKNPSPKRPAYPDRSGAGITEDDK
ncbi:MAG: PDZ domain-containing protein [Planctomycetota bacterium]|nr:PDZ domain-containing protein [Planctomycetota bacterium]